MSSSTSASASVVAFIRLGRPQFLVGGLLLYALGAAVARTAGATGSLRVYVLGQAAVTAIQLMTHYANDYFDAAGDRGNLTPTRWSGGSRVLPSGTLDDRVALCAACALALAALGLIAVLFVGGGTGGRAAAVILVTALALAWAYSAPPFRLHSRGLGELTTALVVTLLVPVAGFVLQAGSAAGVSRAVMAAAPLAGLQFAMLLAIEFPDAAADAAVGKRTLVVRLGPARAARLYQAVLLAVYGSIPLLVAAGTPRLGAIGAFALAPLAAWQFLRLRAGAWAKPRLWAGLAFCGVATLVGTSATTLAAFAWLAGSTHS